MLPKVHAIGPKNAKIMIVGEAPGGEEVRQLMPFVGASGQELDRMLHEARILRTDCFITNVCKYRPPQNDIAAFYHDSQCKKPKQEILDGIKELRVEIAEVQPNVIIALGDTALWALTGERGITKWRGSALLYEHPTVSRPIKVIPTLHPALILRMWDWRSIAVHDLKKAARESAFPENYVPPYAFIVRPSYTKTLEVLSRLLDIVETNRFKIAVDIETRQGQIACVGLAWSKLDAICIPLMCVESDVGYWTTDEEVVITHLLRHLLTHPNAQCIGQNFNYDDQYFSKQYGFAVNISDDTMLQQHVAFPGMKKGLDFLSSMYCEYHRYWKDEGKTWDRNTPEEQLWNYNCVDAVTTYEIHSVLQGVLKHFNLVPQYELQMRVRRAALNMMLRGVRINKTLRQSMGVELLDEIEKRKTRIDFLAGQPLNPNSPKQMKEFFYSSLGCKVQYKKGTGKATLDDKALTKLGSTEPVLRPLLNSIAEFRSLGVFHSTFVCAPLDTDGRMRCSFNVTGTETFRWSSSENAFGSGTNLQNIPKGNEEAAHDVDDLVLPNIRKLFIPDVGYEIFDIDLAGADAQVVAWECDDDILKEIFRRKLKLHAENAKLLFGGSAGADGKREPYYSQAKQGCHGTNYGASARTIAMTLGITVHEAERFQHRWFEVHPNIKDWHRRIEAQLQTTRAVSNKFGYRRFYFDRIEDLLPEALAWIPQSTVALVTDQAILQILDRLPQVELLLQVHDSIIGQYKAFQRETLLTQLQSEIQIVIPYDDPLIIPWGLKTSTVSWGDCEDRKWPDN